MIWDGTQYVFLMGLNSGTGTIVTGRSTTIEGPYTITATSGVTGNVVAQGQIRYNGVHYAITYVESNGYPCVAFSEALTGATGAWTGSTVVSNTYALHYFNYDTPEEKWNVVISDTSKQLHLYSSSIPAGWTHTNGPALQNNPFGIKYQSMVRNQGQWVTGCLSASGSGQRLYYLTASAPFSNTWSVKDVSNSLGAAPTMLNYDGKRWFYQTSTSIVYSATQSPGSSYTITLLEGLMEMQSPAIAAIAFDSVDEYGAISFNGSTIYGHKRAPFLPVVSGSDLYSYIKTED